MTELSMSRKWAMRTQLALVIRLSLAIQSCPLRQTRRLRSDPGDFANTFRARMSKNKNIYAIFQI